MTTWIQRLASAVGFGSSRTLAVSVGMEFDRATPPEWQAALDAESPPCDRLGRLVLVWDAGDRWQPIDRWTILQVKPWRYVDAQEREALLGPHPRTDATRVFNRAEQEWELTGPHIGPVDRLCWETAQRLRRNGVYGLPLRWWVIQGDAGGHPYDLTPTEETLWGQQGRVYARPGLLPYAPFDQRVVTALRPYLLTDLVRHTGDAGQDHATAHYTRQRALQIASRAITWQGWRDLAEKHAPVLAHSMRKDGLHLTRNRPVGAPTPRPVDMSEARERYLAENLLETTA